MGWLVVRLLAFCTALAITAAAYVGRYHPDLIPLEYRDRAVQFSKQVQKRVRRFLPHRDSPPPASGPARIPGSPIPAQSATPGHARTPRPSPNAVTLYLTNGGVVTGELVAKTAEAVTLRWDYGEVSFARQEIKRLVAGRQIEAEEDIVLPGSATSARWVYAHEAVFRLNNGSVVDAKLAAVEQDDLRLLQTVEGGGTIELVIPRAQLDQVMFKAVDNERSQKISQQLETTFPEMHRYEEGLFTILTDSSAPTVKGYWRVIRELGTDFYLTYHPLLEGRRPAAQQYIVVFDNWIKYIDYALSDGIPGWLVDGYFSPDEEVLYLYNMLGDWMSDLLYELFLGTMRKAVDQQVDQIKQSMDSRYEIFLDGLGVEAKAKFERLHDVIRGGCRQQTEETLRHELTHGLFHNWGLQTVVLSRMSQNQLEAAKKKRDYLTSTDIRKKWELLVELLIAERRAGEQIELEAANSWVTEGIASYMQGEPLGSVNKGLLHVFQQAVRDRQVLPLEFLHAFAIGSFPGLPLKAQRYAYAQSWGLVHFLMNRYPEAFLVFLNRFASESATEEEKLAWLLRATGKDLRGLEAEFRQYMDEFPPQDSPDLELLDVLLEISRDF